MIMTQNSNNFEIQSKHAKNTHDKCNNLISKITTENFPNIVIEMDIQTQEEFEILNRYVQKTPQNNLLYCVIS